MTIRIGGQTLPYIPAMRMSHYLRFVIAPSLELECVDDTVLAKVYTPDLSVVFTNQVRDRLVRDLIPDNSELVLRPWPMDVATKRTLVDNAKIHL
jgi:hypothetical protein